MSTPLSTPPSAPPGVAVSRGIAPVEDGGELLPSVSNLVPEINSGTGEINFAGVKIKESWQKFNFGAGKSTWRVKMVTSRPGKINRRVDGIAGPVVKINPQTKLIAR